VGSIPIARSTFRCLACPCVVLGRSSVHRPVPTHSLDAAAVHLIECVDRSHGRVRSRWPHPSVIDPELPLTDGRFRTTEKSNLTGALAAGAALQMIPDRLQVHFERFRMHGACHGPAAPVGLAAGSYRVQTRATFGTGLSDSGDRLRSGESISVDGRLQPQPNPIQGSQPS
jgi:hypothetical protein